MDLEGFLKTAAISTLTNEDLHIKFKKGMTGLLYPLVLSGTAQFEDIPGVRAHFEQFNFVQLKDERSNGNTTVLEYAFDMDAFKKSNQLKAYAESYVEDMEKHAKKLEKQARETREKAQTVHAVYVLDSLF